MTHTQHHRFNSGLPGNVVAFLRALRPRAAGAFRQPRRRAQAIAVAELNRRLLLLLGLCLTGAAIVLSAAHVLQG
jgi:hypothetical protein